VLRENGGVGRLLDFGGAESNTPTAIPERFGHDVSGMMREAGPASSAGIKRVNRSDLIAREFEVEYLEVLGDTDGLPRLRNRRSRLLQMPPQHHLCGRFTVLAPDVLYRWVVKGPLLAAPVGRDSADRRPGLRQDAVLGILTLQRLC
jgi:hypothetical protein